MKKRYFAALATALFAAAGLHPQIAVSWKIVSLVALGDSILMGAHVVDQYVGALDGLTVGAANVDTEDDRE